jgi:hypothetical protein
VTTSDSSNVALLSTTVPNGFGVGAAYLSALLRTKVGQSIRLVNSASCELNRFWPDEPYRRGFQSFVGTIESIVQHQRRRLHNAKATAELVAQWCHANNIKQIWAVLESPFLFRLAKVLADRGDIRMVATVWDPPESITLQMALDRWSRKVAVSDFYDAIGCCSRLGVISDAMADYFTERYPDIPSRVMRLIPDAGSMARHSTDAAEFVVVFAGSVYADLEFRAFLAALDHCDWRIGNRPVRFRVMGPKFTFSTRVPACIEFLGYRSATEVSAIMANADCGYVPYWFSNNYSLAVQLCFPSKLLTCLAVKTPIFYHGPERSTPSAFLERFPAGIACHSLDPERIVKALSLLAGSQREAMADAATRAIETEFNKRNFEDRFHWLITGCDSQS